MRSQIHINRLRRLANHLNAGNLINDYSRVGLVTFRGKNHLFFHEEGRFLIPPFFILEMEHLFPQHFGKNYLGKMIFFNSPKTSIEFVLPWYFGLNSQEYENAFIAGKQMPDLYGSNFILPKSPPKKWAYNIHKFIKAVEHEVNYENIVERKVIIEKLRKDHPNKVFKELEL